MDFFEHLIIGLQFVTSLHSIIILCFGVIVGIFGGAIPGLSPSTTVALLVPVSYSMEPKLALILLTSIYLAANYGGSITAILIKTPGTPAAAVTVLDGWPLCTKGKANLALSMSLWSSGLGGFVGILVLMSLAIPLAKFAIFFGPADYFSLAIFGLATVITMGQGSLLKSLIAVIFGLLIKTIGMDPISGISRFTFGFDFLYEGIGLIPALIGLFAVSGVIEKVVENSFAKVKQNKIIFEVSLKLNDVIERSKIIFSSSIIGTVIGVFPGAGSTIASFISYDIAKKISKDSKNFGSGSLDGIAAAEAANSASVGGALVPLLALGIPGSATDAVLMGAFMLHDLNPGPMLFKNKPDLIYAIFAALLLANLLIILFGLICKKLFLKVIRLNEIYLYSFIFFLATIGSFSVNNSIFDMYSCVIFGIIGYLFKKTEIPIAPIVLGIVLSRMIEENFRRAILSDGLGAFISSPPSLLLLILTIISFVWTLRKNKDTSKSASN